MIDKFIHFFSELRRRNVLRAGGAYIVAGWVLMQVVSVMTPALNLPDWLDSVVAILLIFSFPLLLAAAWIFEITPGGLKRTSADTLSPVAVRSLGWPDYALAAFVIGIGAFGISQAFSIGSTASTTTSEVVETILDDTRLSLGVLPFENENLSKDRAFLVGGMTRDLTSLLSRVPNLRIAPYSSTRTIMPETMSAEAAAAELGVRYIVSGSLTEAGDRLVVRVDLIDVSTGDQQWSERFSEPLDNFFELQDRVIQHVATAIFSEIQASEIGRIHDKSEFDLTVYELIQAAEAEREVYSDEAAMRIVDLLERALGIAPDNPKVKGFLAMQLTQNVVSGYSNDPARDIQRAFALLAEARAVAPRDPQVLMGAGIANFMTGQTEEAHRLLTESLAVDPNEPHAAAVLGWSACYLGNPDQGLQLIRSSEARAPRHPRYALWANYRAGCEGVAGNYEAGRQAAHEAIDRNPNYAANYFLAITFECLLGNEKQARAMQKASYGVNTDFTLQTWGTTLKQIKFPGTPDHTPDELLDLMRTCLGE